MAGFLVFLFALVMIVAGCLICILAACRAPIPEPSEDCHDDEEDGCLRWPKIDR